MILPDKTDRTDAASPPLPETGGGLRNRRQYSRGAVCFICLLALAGMLCLTALAALLWDGAGRAWPVVSTGPCRSGFCIRPVCFLTAAHCDRLTGGGLM
ncbi:hypothetical protein GM31_21485 [Trabulsiella odontotermitis]|uniref:Uncharacterized protein n=1 Tax=Trabulsiella odontotermitis TaxID=379893 RepID=A0A0L0GV94_9ENTR|nr:hypothetical protein GM31_21485 [Trabulsiella odontotermitis]